MPARLPGQSILRTLEELHLSLFLIMFRITRWKGRMKINVASMYVGAVEGMLIISMWFWFQILVDRIIYVSDIVLVSIVCVWFIFSDHYLVRLGRGVAFDKSFGKYDKSRQMILLTASAIISIASVASVIVSNMTYDQVFHIAPCVHWRCVHGR